VIIHERGDQTRAFHRQHLKLSAISRLECSVFLVHSARTTFVNTLHDAQTRVHSSSTKQAPHQTNFLPSFLDTFRTYSRKLTPSKRFPSFSCAFSHSIQFDSFLSPSVVCQGSTRSALPTPWCAFARWCKTRRVNKSYAWPAGQEEGVAGGDSRTRRRTRATLWTIRSSENAS
jgi:hypothetical protein